MTIDVRFIPGRVDVRNKTFACGRTFAKGGPRSRPRGPCMYRLFVLQFAIFKTKNEHYIRFSLLTTNLAAVVCVCGCVSVCKI